jgi:glycosyltransferase involved in cell wall biosynthesis
MIKGLTARWGAYRQIPPYTSRNGVEVFRPAYPQLTGALGPFSADYGAFLSCYRLVRRLHKANRFDAIVGFDLLGTAVMTWRLGRLLGIPAAGWVTGRFPAVHSRLRPILRSLQRLDVIYYQSHETREEGSRLLNRPDARETRNHLVLPRGIPEPPQLGSDVRQATRRSLGIGDDQVLVLSTSRVTREKGVFDLLSSVSFAAGASSRIACAIVGSNEVFDDTLQVREFIARDERLSRAVTILPVCEPPRVWEYLSAADIFAFASHHEGMPNGLLEAMAMSLPVVAFAIPPVMEVEGGTGALRAIRPFDARAFAEALVCLSNDPGERRRIGALGKSHVSSNFMTRTNMKKALELLLRKCSVSVSASGSLPWRS